jgi:hypothetical protein
MPHTKPLLTIPLGPHQRSCSRILPRNSISRYIFRSNHVTNSFCAFPSWRTSLICQSKHLSGYFCPPILFRVVMRLLVVDSTSWAKVYVYICVHTKVYFLYARAGERGDLVINVVLRKLVACCYLTKKST